MKNEKENGIGIMFNEFLNTGLMLGIIFNVIDMGLFLFSGDFKHALIPFGFAVIGVFIYVDARDDDKNDTDEESEKTKSHRTIIFFKEIFIDFLKVNDLYEEYCRNYKECNNKSMDLFFNEKPKEKWIVESFPWYGRGSERWSIANREWCKILRKMSFGLMGVKCQEFSIDKKC